MVTERKPDPVFHFTFTQPARVVLQDKSTALVAVTGSVSTREQEGFYSRTADISAALPDIDHMIPVRCRWIFPVAGNPIKASILLYVKQSNIAAAFEVKDPK